MTAEQQCTCEWAGRPAGAYHDPSCPLHKTEVVSSKKGLTFSEAFERAQKAALSWLPVGSFSTTLLREMRNGYAYGYAAALLAEGAHETKGDHAELLTKIPRVGADFVAEVRELSRHELERRVLIQKDWLHSYSQCLDGLGLKVGLESHRDPRDIRRAVESASVPQVCCQEFDTCRKQCTPLVDDLRRRLKEASETPRRPLPPGPVYEEKPLTAIGGDHRWHWVAENERWECWDCEAYSPRRYDPSPSKTSERRLAPFEREPPHCPTCHCEPFPHEMLGEGK